MAINVVGDWIYYSNIDDNWKIYKIRTDGSGREQVNNDRSWFLSVFGDWIYYEDAADDIYKVRIDGSDRQFVD